MHYTHNIIIAVHNTRNINIIADGQKIAKRISSQVTKETSKMKKLVAEYNIHYTHPQILSSQWKQLSIHIAHFLMLMYHQEKGKVSSKPTCERYEVWKRFSYLRKKWSVHCITLNRKRTH